MYNEQGTTDARNSFEPSTPPPSRQSFVAIYTTERTISTTQIYTAMTVSDDEVICCIHGTPCEHEHEHVEVGNSDEDDSSPPQTVTAMPDVGPLVERDTSAVTICPSDEHQPAHPGVFPSLFLTQAAPSSCCHVGRSQGNYVAPIAPKPIAPFSASNLSTAVDKDNILLGLFLKRHYIGAFTTVNAIDVVRLNPSSQWMSVYHCLPKSIEEMRAETVQDDWSSLASDELPLHVLYRSFDGEVYHVNVRSLDILCEGREIAIGFRDGPTMSEADQEDR